MSFIFIFLPFRTLKIKINFKGLLHGLNYHVFLSYDRKCNLNIKMFIVYCNLNKDVSHFNAFESLNAKLISKKIKMRKKNSSTR